jgi:copper(I)-binding protein
MMFRRSIGTAAFLAAFAMIVTSAAAEDIKVGALQISAPWARATPKGAKVGGGYLTITNSGTTADRLTGGSTAISGRLEIHEMSMSGGVMKMRPLAQGIEIKPGQTVTLKPGGIHMMFVGLKHALAQGEHFKATLQFEKAGSVEVDFSVEGIGATNAGGMRGMSHDNMGGMKMK